MPTKEKQIKQILEALEKLKGSKGFASSARNIRIIDFLVDCYLKDIHVKESVLEIELFKENKQSVSYDGKVRVYMFNLRKKLEEYYRAEGVDDKIIFEIKKGQYNLSLKNAGKQNNKPFDKKLYFIPAVVLVVAALVFIQNKNYFAPSYCWESFFKDEIPTTCCVGDHFIVVKLFPDGKRITSYFGNINSDKEFEENIQGWNQGSIPYSKAPFSFSTKMGPVSTARLAEWFTKNHTDINIAMESEMSVDNISQNNIVYIGPFRTMDIFSSLFLKESKIFSYDGKHILDKETGKEIKDSNINNSRKDHVMVSYNRLTDTGKKILFFAGNNDIGVLAAVKNFTNRKWLKEFYKNIPDNASYFNAIFAVKGIGRTDLECELEQIEILAE